MKVGTAYRLCSFDKKSKVASPQVFENVIIQVTDEQDSQTTLGNTKSTAASAQWHRRSGIVVAAYAYLQDSAGSRSVQNDICTGGK